MTDRLDGVPARIDADAALWSDLEAVCALGGRFAGTDSEARALDFLAGRLHDAHRFVERARDPDHRWLATYVTGADTARAFRLALDYDRRPYDAFFISAADSSAWEPTLERAQRLFGRLPEVRDPARYAREPRASMIDAARARELLGWEPTSSWPELARKEER
jgi:nucleoside-diphosphate-sugar epimerase